MGGIKGTILLLAILGGALALYLKSSISTDTPQALKAESVPAAAPRPLTRPEELQRPVDIVPRRAETATIPPPPPSKYDSPEGRRGPMPDAATLKKVHDFHARERHQVSGLKKRCDAGQEKRQHLCAHADRVMRSRPRPQDIPAGK